MKKQYPCKGGQFSSLVRLLFLACFFLLGVILGQVMATRLPDATGKELDRYLTDYFSLERVPLSSQSIFSALVLYVRYPLAAFFLGFTSVGVLLLPLVSILFGFFLAFSVSCLTAAYAGGGVLVALAAFGLRCLVTIPCYFTLAIPSWDASASLAALSLGRGRRVVSVVYGKQWWLRLASVTAILFLSVCLELFVTPWLLELALEHVLL